MVYFYITFSSGGKTIKKKTKKTTTKNLHPVLSAISSSW